MNGIEDTENEYVSDLSESLSIDGQGNKIRRDEYNETRDNMLSKGVTKGYYTVESDDNTTLKELKNHTNWVYGVCYYLL